MMPANIIGTLAEIDAWLCANASETAADLARAASDDDLDHVCRSLGLDPPADLVALLRRHNGSGDGDMPVTTAPGYGMLGAQGIVAVTMQNC